MIIMETKKNYVEPEVKVIFFGVNSDLITTSSEVSVTPPDFSDIDNDSWI